MSMTNNPLWSTLDAFRTRPVIERRAARRSDVWPRRSPIAGRRCQPTSGRPRARRSIGIPRSRSCWRIPTRRDARTKPAGYAGDARTLDYVYLRDPGSQPITPAGRALFDVSTGVPIAAAVRDRSAALAEEIVRRTAHASISVASIACGHARELDHVPRESQERIRFWGIDQDARSIEHCRSRFDPTRTAFDVGSVRDVLAGRVRIPASDLVYASGLYDYLDQRAGSVLLKRMFASVNVGGSVVIPNLTPHNDEVGYMEAVMDWWMCYRTESDMRDLAALLNADPSQVRTTTFLTSANRIAWLQIDRLA